MGKIVTFYPYKEGSGCTTALVNIAHLLSREGYKVLIVDMDLETPSIPFFINNENKLGFMDLILDYKNFAREYCSDNKVLDAALDKFISCDGYIHHLTDNIWLLPAGRKHIGYTRKVVDFDWDDFYDVWRGGGVLNAMIERWKEKYDYILIDSSHGTSDVASICVVQFPDLVLFFFELNGQNLNGIQQVADGITSNPVISNKSGVPKMQFICSKLSIEGNSELRHRWILKACNVLELYISAIDKFEYIQTYAIPYQGLYSFGEQIIAIDHPEYNTVKCYRKIMNDFILEKKM